MGDTIRKVHDVAEFAKTALQGLPELREPTIGDAIASVSLDMLFGPTRGESVFNSYPVANIFLEPRIYNGMRNSGLAIASTISDWTKPNE